LANPAYPYLVICDTDAVDEIIAAATWKLENDESHRAEMKHAQSTMQAAPPGKNMVRCPIAVL